MKPSIAKLRQEYGNTPLIQENLLDNPMEQFLLWFHEALEAQVVEPNGMTLATVSRIGRPSSRTVLLKDCDRGFWFFTHYKSRKAEQLKEFPFASLTVWWREIHRQVSIEGKVKRVLRSESEAYFAKRPRGAQLTAHASQQSQPLAHRIELEEEYDRLQKQFRGKKIPCPANWGGFRLIPDRMEFWQGRANRLHDRFVYIKEGKEWIISRLSP